MPILFKININNFYFYFQPLNIKPIFIQKEYLIFPALLQLVYMV
ncbi:hypothetical protein J616_00831 [Acinetobacter baumannii 1457504]|nr:hypothetical protein J616_00831 [Acinetobacter baumannii 1457504]